MDKQATRVHLTWVTSRDFNKCLSVLNDSYELEERARIIEFDGGLPQVIAEEYAVYLYVTKYGSTMEWKS